MYAKQHFSLVYHFYWDIMPHYEQNINIWKQALIIAEKPGFISRGVAFCQNWGHAVVVGSHGQAMFKYVLNSCTAMIN